MRRPIEDEDRHFVSILGDSLGRVEAVFFLVYFGTMAAPVAVLKGGLLLLLLL